MADWTALSNLSVGVGGLPSGATVTALRDNPIAIAEGAVGAPGIVSNGMFATSASDAVVLKHCTGGGNGTIILSQTGVGTIIQVYLGETAMTATRDCSIRVAFDHYRGGTVGTQSAAVLRDQVVLQSWSTTTSTPAARSLDVTLTAGQTIFIKLTAVGTTTGGGDQNTGESIIRNVRYMVDQRSQIGI